jgi:hypothetical protein
VPGQQRPQLLEVVGAQVDLVVVTPDVCADPAGPGQLVVPGIAEPCRERRDRLGSAQALHDRRYQAAVDPAAQVGAHRDVGDQRRPHRVDDRVVDRAHRRRRLPCPRRVLVGHPPIGDGRDAAVERDLQAMTWLQLADAREERVRRRYGARGQVRVEALGVDRARQAGSVERLDLRAERDVLVPDGVVERENSHTVARQVHHPAAGVDGREGELSAEALDERRPVLHQTGEHDLGVAVGDERIMELAPQLLVVEDLAVEHQDPTSVGRVHRLVRVGQVDDRQPGVGQAHMALPPVARLVGTAMAEDVAHGTEGLLVHLGPVEPDHPADSTHQRPRASVATIVSSCARADQANCSTEDRSIAGSGGSSSAARTSAGKSSRRPATRTRSR